MPPFSLPFNPALPWAVFSDFDGTITQEDAIVMTLREFAPPQWEALAHAILVTRTLSVREGIAQLYALLPSALRPQIVAFLQANVRLRHGVEALMSWCHQQSIPFSVVSGGLDAFIEPLIAHWPKGQYQLFCNHATFEGPPSGVAMPYAPTPEACPPCGRCACCKVAVLNAGWPASAFNRIVIGDSVTDLGMAQVAQRVYARDALAADLTRMGLPFVPFEDFADIVDDLKRLL
jgi:2-hydroxy-3-keto-5-methylthiopentenyl-1-phosphate phosphatase